MIRRRRIVAVLVLLAVLALIAWGVVAVVGAVRAGAQDVAAPEPTTSAAPLDPTACAPADLDVDVAALPAGGGAPVDLDVTVTNDGESPCLLDAGAGSLVLTVVSGEDRVWSSGDCAGDASRRLLLDAGDSADASVSWSGARSAPGCADGQGSSGAGTYRVEATLGGAELDVREVFTLG